jgi:hypothetical protein
LSLILVRAEKPAPQKHNRDGWFSWIRPPDLPKDIWGPFQQ